MNIPPFIYPITLSNIPVKKMWGGDFISYYLKSYNKIPAYISTKDKIGELWLVTDRKDAMSVVTNGNLKEITLNNLWNEYRKEIFGKTYLKEEKKVFPLLIKIIDAAEDLSLQVHPSEQDLKYLQNAEAKTEMWFVIDNKDDAHILAGFKGNLTNKEDFFQIVNDSDALKKVIDKFPSTPYKYFYIPSGTIHAIGKGNLVFEIQQNSDTTYRVSDWGRKDSDGKSRELHIEQSKICIDFSQKKIFNGKLTLEKEIIEQQISPKNPYFNLFLWNLKTKYTVSTIKTYKFLTVITGKLKINFNNKDYNLSNFDTVLLPIGNNYTVVPTSDIVVFLSYYI